MALAESANLVARLSLQDNFTGPLARAEAGLGRASSGIGRLGGAVSHAGSQLKGLITGPLGLIGLGAGLFSITGALEHGIKKAQDWGLQIEKLTGITGDSAETLSGLLAVTEKYGLSNERLAQIAGFTEKTLGKLTQGINSNRAALVEQQKGLKKSSDEYKNLQLRIDDYDKAVLNARTIQRDFGFSITDTHGKVKDFNTLLLQFSNYWTGSATQAQKAALAAKLFGRGYADLVPILNLGSKGIRDAEQEAAALGLTLSKVNVQDLAKMRESTRKLGDAVGGLELQIGIALIPTITDLATSVAGFIGSHRTDIVSFFKNAVQTGKNVAGTIGNLVGAISGFWNSIPEGMRDLLIKGFVADRTVKFLFGFDPIKGIASGLEGAFSKAVGTGLASAGLGKLFVQPVFVTNPGFGLPGAAGGAAGAAGKVGGVGLLTALFGLGGVAAGEISIAEMIRQALHPNTSGDIVQSFSADEARRYHSGTSVESILTSRQDNLFNPYGKLNPSGFTDTREGNAAFARFQAQEALTTAGVHSLSGNVMTLAKSIHYAIKASIDKLDDRLKHPLLPHSKVNAELHAALRIAKSSESTDQKIKDLMAIDKDLRAGGHKTAHYVQDLIAVEKRKKTSFHVTIPISISERNSVYRISAQGSLVGAGATSTATSRTGRINL